VCRSSSGKMRPHSRRRQKCRECPECSQRRGPDGSHLSISRDGHWQLSASKRPYQVGKDERFWAATCWMTGKPEVIPRTTLARSRLVVLEARLCAQGDGLLPNCLRWAGKSPAILNADRFPQPLPRLFLRHPVDVACGMLPIPFPACAFDPSTRLRTGPTPGSTRAR
jgi:hypothetical protein